MMEVKTTSKRMIRNIAITTVALVVGAILVARVCFGYDVFDRSGWRTEKNGVCCYLDYHGDPLLGWQEIEGNTYYFSPEQQGAMVTGWLDMPEGRYYLNEEGVMQTGWLNTPQGRYYLSETGVVTAGWVETDEGRYYINNDGSVHIGWLDLNGHRYYLAEDGTVHTGWLEWDGARYYCKEDGEMAVGQVDIEGETHHFAANGKYFLLVNRWNPVPVGYTPELVWYEGFQVDASCLEDLTNMVADCNAAGYACDLTSAYRGVEYQTTLFQRKVDKLMVAGYTRAAAEAETSRSIAIPGTSEHHLGLAVDIKSGYNTYGWLAENSWKYGFNFRYPEGSTSWTGIYYEPWHYRYVGKELAAELYERGVCMEEYVEELTNAAERAAD